MSESLMVMADGVLMGMLERDGKRLGFTYDTTWLESPRRFPLSLSMPLALKKHPHSVIEPFLWGLLPDSPQILDEWGKRFHVSPRNVFSIIRHVGEDCAGAVQFFHPERGETHASATPGSDVHWIDDDDLARRIALLLENHGSTRLAEDTGQFSLAGAQPKLALYRHLQAAAVLLVTREEVATAAAPSACGEGMAAAIMTRAFRHSRHWRRSAVVAEGAYAFTISCAGRSSIACGSTPRRSSRRRCRHRSSP